jgi:small subunit ribosomal protein S14
MAKTSSVQKNNRRRLLSAQKAEKRKRLKAIANDLKRPAEERFAARIKLADEMPRNSSPTRIRNRCELTGRARAYYRKLRICRNQLRDLASQGLIPGMTKSSW